MQFLEEEEEWMMSLWMAEKNIQELHFRITFQKRTMRGDKKYSNTFKADDNVKRIIFFTEDRIRSNDYKPIRKDLC